MADLQLPGGLNVRPPSAEQQMLAQIVGTLDALLQFTARIAMGWDPVTAAKDMGLNVPLPPVDLEVEKE